MTKPKSNKRAGRPLGSKDKPKHLVLDITAKPPQKRVPWNKGKKTGRTLPPQMRDRMWKPGQSGNPNGAPKKSTEAKLLSSAYRIQLQEKCTVAGLEHLTWAEAIAVGMAAAAARGDTPAAKEMRETTEGRLPETVKLGDIDGKKLERPVFQVNFVDPRKKKTQLGKK